MITRIGGKHSSVKLAAGAATAYQHDATMLANGTISVFDNGGVPKVHAQSRGLMLAVNAQTKTDTVVAEYDHPAAACPRAARETCRPSKTATCSSAGGPSRTSRNSAPAASCCTTLTWHGSYQSYRSYRFPGRGAPSEPPAIAAAPHGRARRRCTRAGTATPARASWRVLAGPSAQQLTPVASAPRSGFETAITTPVAEAYVAVQALGAAGEVLGTSRTIAG